MSIGSCMELGNLLLQGKNPSGAPTRMKVPMRSKEAEQSVVVMKTAKAEGAKRLHHTALFAGQPLANLDSSAG